MSKLTIIATITAKPEKVAFVKSELLKLIEPTRSERGCIQYDLHQDNDKPAQFLMFETRESRELWQVHLEQQHLKDYAATTEDAIEEFNISEMSHIA